MSAHRPRCRGAFTLIEMLGVLFLISLILSQSVAFYFDVSELGLEATERTRDARRAAAILDRVAHDLESALLVVKPGRVDPLDHPWLFLAEEGAGEAGAERLKFVMRTLDARGSASSVSDLAVVAYGLREGDDGGLALWRSSTPGLPEQLDRSFALEEADGALLLADGLAGFGVRFLSDAGEWKGSWDSSTLVDSGQLPRVAEIAVRMAADAEDPERDADADLTRRVLLPMRPIDLEALLQPQADGEDEGEGEEDASCVTIGECLTDRPEVRQLMPFDAEQLEQLAGTCLTDVDLPDAVLAACLE